MADMGYTDTFIQVATDCPATSGVVPVARGDRKPVHLLQYELLSGHPYRYTHEDLLFEVHVRHKAIPADEREARRRKSVRSCSASRTPASGRRSSPRSTAGGSITIGQGRIALYPMDSEEYGGSPKPAAVRGC